VNAKTAPIPWWKGGAHIACQRMEKELPRVVEGAHALNLSPELNIETFGVHDGTGPWPDWAGEVDQVQAVKCPKTKVGHKQIGGAVQKGKTRFGKRRCAPHLSQIGNGSVEFQSEPSVRLDKQDVEHIKSPATRIPLIRIPFC
jgi:hypothetical protein